MQLSHDSTKCGSLACLSAEVLDALPPVIWFIRAKMRNHRKGISLPQFRTLVMVDQQPLTCLSTLAEFLGASLSTASRIAGGLVDKGLLTRTGCSDDRRQIALAITPQGRAVLEAAWSGTQRQMEEELRQLTGEQRATLVEAMGILKSVFGSMGLPERTDCNGSSRKEADTAGVAVPVIARELEG